jgi:DNA-binding transcriptional MocR family regulator
VAKTISLSRGVPSSDLLAVTAIADAAHDAVLDDPDLALAYGSATGHPALRAWFAELLGVDVDRVLLTNGSLQGLAFLAPQLAGPADWIAIEAPTYDFSLRRLRSTGARLVGIPVERDGLDVEGLERRIAADGPPACCYTIPTFHNPTGSTMAADKRHGLLALAREHDFRVVEDDPYRLLSFEGEPPPTLLSADPERVIHLSTLSKTVAPGLRCGALVLPPELFARTAEIAQDTYLAPGHLAQATAARYVRSPAFAAGVANAVAELRIRRDRLLAGLRRLGLPCDTPAGGYFAWPRVPGVDADELARAAGRAGLEVMPGTRFFLGEGGDQRLRLTWAAAGPAEIDDAVERLRLALSDLVPSVTGT